MPERLAVHQHLLRAAAPAAVSPPRGSLFALMAVPYGGAAALACPRKKANCCSAWAAAETASQRRASVAATRRARRTVASYQPGDAATAAAAFESANATRRKPTKHRRILLSSPWLCGASFVPVVRGGPVLSPARSISGECRWLAGEVAAIMKTWQSYCLDTAVMRLVALCASRLCV